jgi:hypothetical protein
MNNFRKIFAGYLIKEGKDGIAVVSRTATERESIMRKAKLNKLDLVEQRISPDFSYFRLRINAQPQTQPKAPQGPAK